MKVRRGKLKLRWKIPWWLPFPMPVPVRLGEEVRRVAMPRKRATVAISEGVQPIIDPQHWLLKVEVR